VRDLGLPLVSVVRIEPIESQTTEMEAGQIPVTKEIAS
jgi:hypothetical protein